MMWPPAAVAGENVVLPKARGNSVTIDRLANTPCQNGYTVDLVLLDGCADIAMQRVIRRLIAPDRMILFAVMKKGLHGAEFTYDMLKTSNFINAHARTDNIQGPGQPRRIVEDAAQSYLLASEEMDRIEMDNLHEAMPEAGLKTPPRAGAQAKTAA